MPIKYRIETGDVLFSWSGNPDTSIDTFIWTRGAAWLNQHIFKVVPASFASRAFVYGVLKHLNPVFTEIARDKQKTGLGHVTVADLKRLKISMPPQDLIAQWNNVSDSLIDQIVANELKSRTLERIRDELLPRLMSGSLTLSEAA
ncbi:MAG: restriction endonuclease subunit S [Panacagrimonas sp.]